MYLMKMVSLFNFISN